MVEAIDKSAGAEDAVAELAADALRSGKDVSERSNAWKAKKQRDESIAELALLKSGFTRLQGNASALEREVASAHLAVVEAREPIIQSELRKLAEVLGWFESEAAATQLTD
jgi:hypothetical protein